MRLIDASYQDRTLKYWLDTNAENGVTWIPSNIIKNILDQPNIDAVPVVRCKDCVYMDWDCKEADAIVCKRTNDGFWRSSNDFCSYGVPMSDKEAK